MTGTRLPDYCGVCCVAETGRAVMFIPKGERWSELSSARDANCAGLYKSSLGISVTKVGHVAVLHSVALICHFLSSPVTHILCSCVCKVRIFADCSNFVHIATLPFLLPHVGPWAVSKWVSV